MPNLSRSYHQPAESVKKITKTIISVRSAAGLRISNVIPPLKRAARSNLTLLAKMPKKTPNDAKIC
jgi:hypothetical protein